MAISDLWLYDDVRQWAAVMLPGCASSLRPDAQTIEHRRRSVRSSVWKLCGSKDPSATVDRCVLGRFSIGSDGDHRAPLPGGQEHLSTWVPRLTGDLGDVSW